MKKSRDSRDVFAVFKKGSFMEKASFSEKLRYWFKNVYWYHFRTATFLALAAVVFAVTLISDIANREHNDLDYILAGVVYAEYEQLDAFSDYLGSFIETEEGEKVKVGGQLLCTQSIAGTGDSVASIDQYNAVSIEKITVSMADDEVLLFFFDKRYADWYAEESAFAPLSEFGIESENGYFVRVDNLPVMEQFGFISDSGIYAAIKMKNESRARNERILEKYENAGKALSGLLGGE
ncbi:MAG: hypothetical protein IKU65_01350 [Oscillospiraceae bacterium]|nr:hypothetical protein [Oscillospiraceae bacterium]